MKPKTCAILVKRPCASASEIKAQLEAAILRGCNRFLSGMECGAGLTAAECVLTCRKQHPTLSLECVIPYEEYAAVWDEPSRDRYFDVLNRCDTETMLQRQYTPDCMELQQEYLIRHSEETILI